MQCFCSSSNNLLMLVCQHKICLKCAEQSKQLETSLLQNKYWVQCRICQKKTFSYDFSNLLIDNHELSLLTDRSQQQQLNESQLMTIIEPLVFHRRRSMNTIALDYKQVQNVTPVKKVSSDNRKMNSQRKIPTQTLLQKGTTLLKQNYTKQASPVSKKGPQHKRCYTGIIEQNKASISQRQMALQQILNLKPKFKTTYSKKTSSSLYNYLLSLSYKHSILEKKPNDHTFTSGLKDTRNDKNRCFSQIKITKNINNKKKKDKQIQKKRFIYFHNFNPIHPLMIDPDEIDYQGDERNVRARPKNNTSKRINKREILERAYKKEQRLEQAMYFGQKEDLVNTHQVNQKQIETLQKQLNYQKDQEKMAPKAKGKAKRGL
ncbi:hypothetical protein pb186bvf_018470 [Paramecium bursaria]